MMLRFFRKGRFFQTVLLALPLLLAQPFQAHAARNDWTPTGSSKSRTLNNTWFFYLVSRLWQSYYHGPDQINVHQSVARNSANGYGNEDLTLRHSTFGFDSDYGNAYPRYSFYSRHPSLQRWQVTGQATLDGNGNPSIDLIDSPFMTLTEFRQRIQNDIALYAQMRQSTITGTPAYTFLTQCIQDANNAEWVLTQHSAQYDGDFP